jgi:hypothetical protein
MLSPAGVNKSVDFGNKGSRNYQSVDKSFASTRSLRNNNLIVVTTNNHTPSNSGGFANRFNGD